MKVPWYPDLYSLYPSLTPPPYSPQGIAQRGGLLVSGVPEPDPRENSLFPNL